MYRQATYLVIVVFLCISTLSIADNQLEIRMSINDTFRIEANPNWQIDVEKELTLRFADISIQSKNGYSFSMMLYFKCDTPDLAAFDTPEKIAESIQESSKQYLPHIVEKEITLQPVPVKNTFGYFTIMTDAELIQKSQIEPDEYIYLTRGMVRLSNDSVLGFSLMTNDVTTSDYNKLMEYIYHFVKL